MADTFFVLVIYLICQLPFALVAYVAFSYLAKRNGQAVKSISCSPQSGITAEFYEPSELSADKTD